MTTREDHSVNDIPDADLLGRAVRSFRPPRSAGRARTVARWSAVSDLFGLGSTYSAQLCRRFGCDPNEQVKP